MKTLDDIENWFADVTLKAHRSRCTACLVIAAGLACAGAGAFVLGIVLWIGG